MGTFAPDTTDTVEAVLALCDALRKENAELRAQVRMFERLAELIGEVGRILETPKLRGPREKPLKLKPKPCERCGRDFKPKSGVQKRCDECRSLHIKEYRQRYDDARSLNASLHMPALSDPPDPKEPAS